MASQQIITEQTPVAVGAGVESISLVQMGGMNLNHFTEDHLMKVKPALWMAMIETAEIVAERYLSAATGRTPTPWKASAAPLQHSRADASRTRSCRLQPG